MTRRSAAAAQLGAHARRFLARLESAGPATRLADGGARHGSLAAPASLIAQLERQELVRVTGDAVEITAPGRRWLARALTPRQSDGAYLQNRIEVTRTRETPEGRRAVTVNLGDNPLAWLMGRKLLTIRQFEASERLRADYERSQRGPAMTMRWDAPPVSRNPRGAPDAPDPTLAQMSARRRLDAALDQAGSGLSDALVRIVCEGHGIETAEKILGWPPRSARLVLGFALDRVAQSYGL